MGQFSDDGQWWWDGVRWTATAHVVLPDLPTTNFEQSGKLQTTRLRMSRGEWIYWNQDEGLLSWLIVLRLALGYRLVPAWRDYRSWTLEQLALATSYLLGPGEALLAGEVNLQPPDYVGDSFKRDLAVAVTAEHVLVFRIDSFEGQPRWIGLAARPSDVKMEARWVLDIGSFSHPLVVSRGDARWVIHGFPGVSKLKAVVDAWRKAASAAATTR
jgi:hypothetical protein